MAQNDNPMARKFALGYKWNAGLGKEWVIKKNNNKINVKNKSEMRLIPR